MDKNTIKAFNIFLTLSEAQKEFLTDQYDVYITLHNGEAYGRIYSIVEFLAAGYSLEIFNSLKDIIFNYLSTLYKKDNKNM